MKQKDTLFRQIQRMFSRRRHLLLLIILPLFVPLQTIKPHYKVNIKLKLNPPHYTQGHIERMDWLTEQIDILSAEELLSVALKRAGLSGDEVDKQLSFVRDNLDIIIEGNETLNIELATMGKSELKKIANEIVTIYFDIASRERRNMQTEIYESQKRQLKSLNDKLKEARITFDVANIVLENFQKKKTTDDTQPLKREIEELKIKLTKLQTIYTEEHPQVKEIVRQIANNTQRLNNKQLRLTEEDKKEVMLRDGYQKKKILLDKLSEEFNLLKTAMVSPKTPSIGSTISRSEIVSIGTAKAKLLDLSGKLIFGIIIAFSFGSITEGLDKTVWNEDEIKRDLGIRTLGTIIKPKKRPASGLLLDYPKNSAVIKSFETLRSNIQFINLATPLKSILYSSLLKERDLLAANLAISMTFIEGKVGLINVSGKLEKYSPVLTTTANKDSKNTQEAFSFKDTVINNLKILNIEDANTLEKQQLNDLMANLKEKYDVIIIDSPAIAESVPCATIASIVDGVILGAAAKRTEREFLLRNYKILGEINARVLGVVLQ